MVDVWDKHYFISAKNIECSEAHVLKCSECSEAHATFGAEQFLTILKVRDWFLPTYSSHFKTLLANNCSPR